MLIDGKKYACATCIAGHRTSKCQHRDGRELKEVKARGRPTTQCDICRERRRQGGSAHGRCSCGGHKSASPGFSRGSDARIAASPSKKFRTSEYSTSGLSLSLKSAAKSACKCQEPTGSSSQEPCTCCGDSYVDPSAAADLQRLHFMPFQALTSKRSHPSRSSSASPQEHSALPPLRKIEQQPPAPLVSLPSYSDLTASIEKDLFDMLLRAAEMPSLQSLMEKSCNCKGGCRCRGCLASGSAGNPEAPVIASCCSSKRTRATSPPEASTPLYETHLAKTSQRLTAVPAQPRLAETNSRSEVPASVADAQQEEEEDRCDTCVACDVDMRLPTGIPVVDDWVERQQQHHAGNARVGQEEEQNPRLGLSSTADEFASPAHRDGTTSAVSSIMSDLPRPTRSMGSAATLALTSSQPSPQPSASMADFRPKIPSAEAAATEDFNDEWPPSVHRPNPALHSAVLHGSIVQAFGPDLVGDANGKEGGAGNQGPGNIRETAVHPLHVACDACQKVVCDKGEGVVVAV